MKIVCISDTHGSHTDISIPEGDILLHAGDLSNRGKEHEIQAFNTWLGTLPHRYKIIIAGNHDFMFERQAAQAEALITQAIYLKNSFVEIEGIKIWGSPITPWFYDWAFNRHRGEAIRKYWELIPADTDILITHGPPQGILDTTVHGSQVGCADLLKHVFRVKPKLHLFGHIHEGYGQLTIDNIHFVNASLMNVHYKPVNEPLILEW